MNLATYLSRSKTTYEAFAQKIGVSPFAVGKWARGERVPRQVVMGRISAATEGSVTPNDFFEITDSHAPATSASIRGE